MNACPDCDREMSKLGGGYLYCWFCRAFHPAPANGSEASA